MPLKADEVTRSDILYKREEILRKRYIDLVLKVSFAILIGTT